MRPISDPIAAIDRRVQIIDGSDEQRESIRRISELRQSPFVVILGEPGIGKSTVLATEAARENAPVLKVRELMTGANTNPDATLFLDALDEYRIDGQAADKVHRLARAIGETRATRWRLSCRSEDWRKGADIVPIERTTAGIPIVAVQLLPLDHFEASAILTALNEDDPDAFLSKARALGASGFVESPLSLKLLHKIVTDGGQWPATRYDLFEAASARLAYESNDEYKFADRSAPHEIIAAAGNACLTLLASGSRALWRSNAEPPDTGDTRAYVTGHETQIDQKLLNDILDTPLFRGEGEAFEPIHRTVAEFLAGHALARAVIGDNHQAALPLNRAIALITGEDRRPPTELRGLYAWFAAHLAKGGDDTGATALIEADAVTVLMYGDAAAFGTPGRRAIFANLDTHDPFFRSTQVGVTAVGGLAGEDLATDFAAALTVRSEGSHRLATVLEVLTIGRPIQAIRPLLRSMALDRTREGRERRRAADAWLNGESDPAALRDLFDELADEPVSFAREELRVHLATMLQSLTIRDIKVILTDLQRCPQNSTVGRLYGFQRKLEAEPPSELFDDPIDTWLPKQPRQNIDIEFLIDHVLAAAIRTTPNLSAQRLWRWMKSVRENMLMPLSSQTGEAVSDWLIREPGRDVALFEVILAEDNPTKMGPWTLSHIYFRATGQRPTLAAIRHVLAKAAMATSSDLIRAYRLLGIAVEMVRDAAIADAYWETLERVSNFPDGAALLERLTMSEIEQWRVDQYKREEESRRQHAAAKASNVEQLAPILAELRLGQHPQTLDWAAGFYFRPPFRSRQRNGLPELDYIIGATDAATIDAILAGWRHLATADLGGADTASLGRAHATGKRLFVEWPAIAGLDRMLLEEQLPESESMPVTLALAILNSSYVLEDKDRRKTIEAWAVARLNLDPAQGASQLVDYWSAYLDAGATQISTWLFSEDEALGPAVADGLERILAQRPAMAIEVLRSMLWAAAKHLDQVRIKKLASAALSNSTVIAPQRTIWSFINFALDPLGECDRFVQEHAGGQPSELFGEMIVDDLLARFRRVDSGARVHLEATAIHLFGRACSPSDELLAGVVTREKRMSEVVRGAVNWLTLDTSHEATEALARLIADPDLLAWRPSLRHGQAQQARLRRDQNFKHPRPEGIQGAISGGPPVNAADLHAVVLEVLGRLRSELRTNNSTPWKRYWNTDKHGKVTTPLVENQCRDHLLDRLRDRLGPYHIAAVIPEARQSEETRSDMLILTGAGKTLPIEVKRHFHPNIWTAASTQLQGYAADEGAAGYGIYLIFWFGTKHGRTPPRPDELDGPQHAHELESMLIRDLAPNVRARTDVLVFDVSDPNARAKRKSKKPASRSSVKKKRAPPVHRRAPRRS